MRHKVNIYIYIYIYIYISDKREERGKMCSILAHLKIDIIKSYSVFYLLCNSVQEKYNNTLHFFECRALKWFYWLKTILALNFNYIYIYVYHHHHVALVARISLTLSRHSSLSFIALGRSSGQHPVSSHSCWMYVRAGRPAFARPCVGVHRSTSLMSSSLLLQQCPACLVRLTLIVFEIGGRWPYSWCLVGCCRQDLFKIARSILV